MLDPELYKQIKKKYGKSASWAIWADAGDTPKSNIGDLSVFNDKDVHKKLNPHYVFVGLNPSVQETNDETWRNFHSLDNKRQNDYKLRYALKDTKYWGAYITDLNATKETDSTKVFVSDDDVKSFKTEISLLKTKPVLVALGDKVYNALIKCVKNEYTIVKIKHFSCYISKGQYRKSVLKDLACL